MNPELPIGDLDAMETLTRQSCSAAAGGVPALRRIADDLLVPAQDGRAAGPFPATRR